MTLSALFTGGDHMTEMQSDNGILQRRVEPTSGPWLIRIAASALAIVPMLAGTVKAAEGAPTSELVTLEDVIVTARRVEERLQDIPASVVAITGDDVARMGSLADLQSKMSGVTFQAIGPVPVVGIRGFGNRSQAGNPSNSAVGIFQDGVFVASALSTIINRTDTERVEVAKGPQSTLYGRSSFTGAFNIVTADPANHLSGYLDAGYGAGSVSGDNLWRVQGAVSVPLADTLSIRIYGLDEKRDGYVLDSATGDRSGGHDRQIGRLRLLWQPSDAVTARLTGAIMRDDIPLPLATAGRIRAPLGQAVVFANPASPASRAALQFGNTVWDAHLLTPQHSKIKGEQGTLDLRFRTPFGELASLTDYQHATLDPFFSLDLTRLNWANGSGTYYEKRYSQELRVSNKVDRLSYLYGLYFLDAKVEQGGGKAVDLTKPFASFAPGSLQFDLAHLSAIYQPAYTATRSYAAFGQVGYALTDRLDMNLGLRYGRDKISGPAGVFLRTQTGVLVPSTPFTDRSAEFNSTTGSANLSYHITPDAIAYGSYARGNSPGGLNVGAVARQNFGPQNVDAFEVGLKSRLLDNHLQLNLALFDNQYSGLQLSQNVIINGAITSVVTNAAKAHGRGFDMDAIAILSKYWRFGLQYTYVDSKITDYTLPAPPAPQVDLTGVPLVRSPKNSLNASVTFSHDIGPGYLRLTAAESYTSSYTNDYQGVPAGFAYPGIAGSLPAGVTASQVLGLYRTDGYALTNLDASYSWDKFQISGSVRNLLNKQYIATVLAFDMVTVPLEVPGAPRTVELSFKVNF
jgi:iron complex outermembrane receptor protein